MRIGFGYDLHRLAPDRPLILGGIHVPHNLGLSGHSDADVLAHAVIDALLGATALGNIGQLYPDTDPQYKDADSMDLLRRAWTGVRDAGYRLINLDATIVAEQPKLNPHLDHIRGNLAKALDVPAGAVSIKAKTNEGVGPEGRGEAISTYVTALLAENTD